MMSLARRPLAAFCLLAWLGAAAGAEEAPAWLSKTIIPEDKFIYAIGSSDFKDSEKEAKDEALVRATEEFVKYCGVEVESFIRSVEVYSKAGGKDYESADIQAQSQSRAKAFVSRAIPESWHMRREKKRHAASVLLKVPREEFDRIVKERAIKLSLDILFYYEDEDGKMKVLTDGSVLRSGDGYAVYLKASDPCHLYVYQIDALGKSFRLFPNVQYNTASNPVSPGTDLWLPNADELLFLDETTGKERFYIFASPNPIRELEGEGSESLSGKDLENVVALKKMGAAGVRAKRDSGRVAPPKREKDVVDVKKKLQAEGAFAYETWFWHK